MVGALSAAASAVQIIGLKRQSSFISSKTTRGRVQVVRRFSPQLDHAVNPIYLFLGQSEQPRDFCCRYAVVLSIKTHIHRSQWHREKELLLGLLQRIGVGRRAPAGHESLPGLQDIRQADGPASCRDARSASDRQLRPRASRRTPGHLKPIRGSGHRIVQKIGVIVLDHLPHALFTVCRGNDGQIGGGGKSCFFGLSGGGLHHDGEYSVAILVDQVRQHDLALVAFAILRHYQTYCIIAALVAAQSLKNRRNRFGHRRDAEMVSHQLFQSKALRRRIDFGHEDHFDAVQSNRPSSEERHDATVDPS